MLDITKKTCLLDELKRLANAEKAADFSFSPDIGSLPDGEQETALLIKKVLDHYRTVSEYDLMRYRLTGESLGVGHWDMGALGENPDSLDNKFIWSPELRRMLGYSGNNDFSDILGNWLEHLHPDDRNRAFDEFSAHLADRTGTTPFVTEYRLRKKSGEYIHARAFGMALRDSMGAPVRIAGAVENITEAKSAQETLQHRERTMDILNKAALMLLSRKENSFEDAMTEGLALIADIADIDRMSIFRNSTLPDGLHMSQIYRWRKDANGTVEPWPELKSLPYAAISTRYEEMLAAGEHVVGPIRLMPERDFFARFGCVGILAVPVFDDGKFWGFTFYERLTEEVYTEQEIEVLRSASFMLANAVIRNEEAKTIRQTKEQIQQMLDAVPMSITMWDREYNVLDCSQYAVDLFGFSSKRELIERLAYCAPEVQPCGKKSMDLIAEESAKAFSDGHSRIEWTQLTTSGEPILLDANAIRIKRGNDDVLMLCSRDIREEKRMLAELKERDEMLAAQAHWYKSLLDCVPMPISVTDTNMNITFTNTASAALFGKERDFLIGQPCRIWNVPICGTDECSIACMRRGVNHTFFKAAGKSYKVDSEVIYDLAGELIGYLEILNDVTEIENAAKREAEAANEAKNVFLAQMSHEMRTPLSAVIGLSELVLENGGLNRENEVYLDKIYNAGSTLLSIVNDILDISKIEAGKFEIHPQEYDVPSLINDAITQNVLRIHSKPVHFTLNINENVPARLYGDDIRVKQVLSNLLSNAFKYTDDGAVKLHIDYERNGNSIWTTFRVSDTGVGIRPDDLERLFTDYTRFDETVNRKISGTGLGLSITKRLVELMDGEIAAESEYGKGSVFTAKIRQQHVNDSVIGIEMAEHLRNFQYTTSKRRSGSQLNRVRIPYARVLVVDDNLTNLDIAKGLMKPYGMEIDCVTSGQAAIEAIREKKHEYSAVFMDHMMPGMDGVEAVRIIRNEIESGYAKTIPIIALTANAVAGNREWFISQGFNAFVSKPIDIFRLDSVIRRWIWAPEKESFSDDSPAFVEKRENPDRRNGGDRRISNRRNIPDERLAAGKIEGVDWAKGIDLFGDEESFLRVLRSFAVNTLPLLEKISEVSAGTLADYAITVHGIKSSSRGICAGEIGALAETLELSAKSGNLDSVVSHNSDFLKAARKLIEGIEAYLRQSEKPNSKPVKTKPDAADLKRLCDACAHYDMDEIEAAMQEIESYEYTADEGLSDWLRDNVAKLNYAQVIERITQTAKTV
jgi:PAS domain S-box-containing protein